MEGFIKEIGKMGKLKVMELIVGIIKQDLQDILKLILLLVMDS